MSYACAIVVRDEQSRRTHARTRLSSIGHGQGPGAVADPGREFVGDASVGVAADRTAVARFEARIGRRAARPRARTVRILGMRATELVHKIRYDPVEVHSVVKTAVCEVNRGSGKGRGCFGVRDNDNVIDAKQQSVL